MLEVVAGVGQLALRPVQIAARRIGLRQPRAHRVPDELVAGRGPAQEIGEQADGIGRMALGQRQPAAVVHDPVAHVVHAPRVRRRVGGGELAGRLVPVALADGHPGESLAGEHDVLEEIPPLRHGEAFEERGPRGGELARGRLDLARVLAGDHAAFGEPERIADVGRSAELVGGGREIAHAERQHAEPAVGVAQALEVSGDAGARHGLLEGQPCLPQAAVRLEDVAPARLDPGQARLLVRGPEQRGRPVHGDERAVVMAPQALQQPRDLEAMAGQLTLADPLGHGGAVPDQRRAVLVSPHALIQAAAAEILGAVAAVARRKQGEHRIERGVERGRVAASRVGESDERGDLRRPVVQPPRLGDDEPQEGVGAADLAACVGHTVEAEPGANGPGVRAAAGAREEPAEQPLGALEVVRLTGDGGEAEDRFAVGAVAGERLAPAERHPIQAVVLQGPLGGADHALGIGLALRTTPRTGGDERGEAEQEGQTRHRGGG